MGPRQLIGCKSGNGAHLELCVSDWFCGNGAYRLQRYLPANQPAQPREYLSVDCRFRNQGMETFEITVVSGSVLGPFGTDRSTRQRMTR